MSTPPSVDDVLRVCGFATLGEDPPVETVEKALRQLADAAQGADPLRREALRAGALRVVRPLGWRAAAVDAVVGVSGTETEDGRQGRALVLVDVEPWPDPVDGAELLTDVAGAFERYLAQPDGATTAEALWTVHTHAHDAASVSPLLGFTSATKRCGKTTAVSVLGALVPRPLPASNVTPAAIYRTVEAHRPTLLVDEADTFLAEREELRGLLNSGHTRSAAVVVRCAEPDWEPRLFSTWGPKVIALIGELPDTLRDRAVEVRLRRRRPDERVERVRLDRLHLELEPLRRRAARWARDHMRDLAAADPDVPSGLHDRAADNWRPLLAIADLAGGPWPERARRAALLLSGAEVDDGDVRVLLLTDLRRVMDGRERMASADIVRELLSMEDRPWPEWRRGQPLTARGLARLLEPFGVRPKPMDWGTLHSKGTRGYTREDLAAVWSRYLPPSEPQPPQPSNDGAENGSSTNRNRAEQVAVAGSAENPRRTTKVAEVAVADPELWEDYEAVERAAIQAEDAS